MKLVPSKSHCSSKGHAGLPEGVDRQGWKSFPHVTWPLHGLSINLSLPYVSPRLGLLLNRLALIAWNVFRNFKGIQVMILQPMGIVIKLGLVLLVLLSGRDL